MALVLIVVLNATTNAAVAQVGVERFRTDNWTGTTFRGVLVEREAPVDPPTLYGPWLVPLPDAPPLPPARPSNQGWNVALDFTMANAVPWALNRYAKGVGWSRVGTGSWGDNITSTPEFDDNSINANHIDHPVHGGMYFTAGRVNGLGFWSSAPLAPLGSALWEYFAETNTPSLNDLVITSIGGITVGEATFRASELIVDDQSTGVSRALREVAAFLVSPGVGLHRLVRGKSWRTVTPDAADAALGDGMPRRAQNKVEANFGVGARSISPSVRSTPVQQGVFNIDLRYGDPYGTGSWTAFQAFTLRATAVTGQYPALSDLAISGLLGRTRISGSRNQVIAAELNYDVTVMPGFSFSGPGIGGVLMSRMGTGPLSVDVAGRLAALPLSAISNDRAPETIDRPYDYGSGIGAGIGASVRHRAGVLVEARYDHSQLWATSAAAAGHQVTRLAVRARVPLVAGIAAEAEYFRTAQRTLYDNEGTTNLLLPEVRVMISTMLGSPAHRSH